MNIDFLREEYKNLRPSKFTKEHGNTFKKSYSEISFLKYEPSTITIFNNLLLSSSYYESIDKLNIKYRLNSTHQDYSLNKHKRWDFVQILKENLENFNENNIVLKNGRV